MRFFSTRRGILPALVLSLAALAGTAGADTGIRPLDLAAISVRQPQGAFMLGAARAGDRIVAVGERGVVALSDDNGVTWRQARVPVSVTLTAVAFGTPRDGWAIGHFGVILRTADGGETWTRQMDGLKAADIVLASGPAEAPPEQQETRELRRKRVKPGAANLPFLSVLAVDRDTAIVFGPYRMTLRTTDGGATWQDWSDRLTDSSDFHTYAVSAHGQTVVLASEGGEVLRSVDGGGRFDPLTAPADATLFGVAATRDGAVVAGGLRGRMFRSQDGARWEAVKLPTEASVTGLRALPSGRLVAVTGAGEVLVSTDGGRSFGLLREAARAALSDVVEAADGALVTVGARGVARLANAPS